MSDPRDFLPLTAGFFEILLTLAEGDAHGYAIMQAVGRRTHGAVKLLPGTMYRAFARLQEQGLLEEAPAGSSGDPDDSRRRTWRLTGLGRAVAAAEADRLAASVRRAERLDLLSDAESS